MGNTREELGVRDPTGLLKMIRKFIRDEEFKKACEAFCALDDLLSSEMPCPMQWNSELMEEWVDWDQAQAEKREPVHYYLRYLRCEASLVVAPDCVMWQVGMVDEDQPGDEREICKVNARNIWASGVVAKVARYYNSESEDRLSIAQERAYSIMHMLNRELEHA